MAMNRDNVMSLVRSGLKIVGMLVVSAGFANADTTGQIVAQIEILVGTVMTLAGLFMSFWEHTPDAPPVTLVKLADGSYIPVATLPPTSILPPADVEAVMAQHPEPKP
jgi:hypothetical protein